MTLGTSDGTADGMNDGDEVGIIFGEVLVWKMRRE